MKKTMPKRSKSESGQAVLEFALVTISLAFMLAGVFTVGELLSKALQVSNITRSAAVLMVRSITDTKADLNLVLTQNQRILIREANGLGMAKNAQYDPDPNGKGAVFLTKIIHVGGTECAASGATAHGSAPLWDTGNCPNFDSYVWAYYVPIGNNTTWTSAFGTPQASDIHADGTVTPTDIGQDTAVQVPTAKVTAIITLAQSQYALIAETFADVSSVAIFSVYKPPVVYYRTIT
jgi:hypothetical protein